MKILPVIFSGGSGTRLWPLSRAGHPKQFQELHGKGSLLQQTAQRLAPSADILPPVIICNLEQRFIVAEQLREKGITPSLIVLEPVGRSTAPALAIPALWVQDPEDTVMVAMPSDHAIIDHAAFEACVRKAAALAFSGRLMTIGICPTKPHTGFGYIEKGQPIAEDPDSFNVRSFKEKPNADVAQTYLDSGHYLWNSGIFVFRADSYMAELDKHEPAIGSCCRDALKKARQDLDFFILDKESFANAPNISVDYAVMERSQNIGVVPAQFGWNDVGGWEALWELGDKDVHENVLIGDVMTRNVSGSYIRSDDKLVAVIGLDDLVVINTKDAVLVSRKSCVDEVKEIVAELKTKKRSECHSHQLIWRPWGYYERLDGGDRFQVKRIMVKPGAKLSLQMHHHRAEHWIVVSGTARIVCGETEKLLAPNESVYIPLGEKHQLENPGKTPLHLIEVQSGDYLGEDDIVRYQDVYGRIEN